MPSAGVGHQAEHVTGPPVKKVLWHESSRKQEILITNYAYNSMCKNSFLVRTEIYELSSDDKQNNYFHNTKFNKF